MNSLKTIFMNRCWTWFLLAIVNFNASLIAQSINDVKKNRNKVELYADSSHAKKVSEDLIQVPEIGYWAFQSNKYKLFDHDSNLISNNSFDQVRSFSFGRAAVRLNDKWGFVNKYAEVVIPIEYDFVYYFSSYSTIGIKNKECLLFDTSGTVITRLDIDYFFGFKSGKAKIIKDNKFAYIDSTGQIVEDWIINPNTPQKKYPSIPSPLSGCNSFCPSNLDFADCDFTNWQCYEGSYRTGNLILNPSSVNPVRHQIVAQGSVLDSYGGFPISPPDGSSCAVRLGNPNNGAEAERLEYSFFIPDCVTDYTFMYQYALVFQDPGHPAAIQPKFRVELFDETSGQIVACASVDYTAGFGGASFFSESSAQRGVFYKPWTSVFINLGKYHGKQLKLTFTTMDCGAGGHWCYAYIDINACGYSGLSALNSCSVPNTTTLQGPPGFSSYVWSTNPNLSNSLGNTQSLVVPPPGLSNNSTVYVQVIPENGVSCSDTLSIPVKPYTVKASFPAQVPQCLRNNSFTFNSFSQTNGSSISNYLWDFDDNTTSLGSTVTHQFTYPDTFHVKLTTTTAEGCVDDTTINVVVLASPQLRVNGTNICEGINPLVTLSGANSYVWNPRNGLLFTSSMRDSIYFGINNNTSYTVTAKDTTNGCYMDSVIQINYYPNPVADFAQPAPQCLRNNNFTFNNTTTFSGAISTINYLWAFGDDSTSNQFSPNHAYDTAGTYLVDLIATSPKGCKDTMEKQIIVNAHPSSNIFATGSLKLCYTDSVILKAIGQAGSGAISNYQWYNNGNIIPGANQSTIKIDTTSSINLVVENTNGCKDTSLIQPVIAHPLPTGFLTTSPTNTTFICNGSSVEIKVNQSTATSYQWYYTDLAGSFSPRPIVGEDSSSVYAMLPGRYSLQMTTATFPACKGFAIDTIDLTLIKKPVPNFSYPIYCAGQPIAFQNLSNFAQSGATSWLWDFGDLTPNTTLFNPIHTYKIGTNYLVTLTATPDLCPNLDSSIKVLVKIEEPVPSIRYPAINAVKFINTPLKARNFANLYRWEPRVGLLNGSYNVFNPIFNYNQEVDYKIYLETNAGCKTVDTQLVRVFILPDIQVPTAFTPNGDGHNDGLDVFTIGIEKFKFFRIFNRWGQLIYETNDYRKKWNGTYKTVKQPAETYVWIAEGVDQRGNVINRRGQFILIR